MNALVAVALLAPALGFARHMLLFHCYWNEGIRLEQARAAAAPLFESHGPKDPVYAIGPSSLLLTERYDRLRVIRVGEPYPDRATGVVTQYENNVCKCERKMPPFEVLEDHYIQKEPRWLGIHLGEGMPGYQFAVIRLVGKDDNAVREHESGLPRNSR